GVVGDLVCVVSDGSGVSFVSGRVGSDIVPIGFDNTGARGGRPVQRWHLRERWLLTGSALRA
ncbi:hypothetical protein, partial [Pseudomonas gingeri]|uniref:hypothetical protein n=1 Tax=Pseudomonas gingeri TaxID=117681 RepID=UPI001C435F7E